MAVMDWIKRPAQYAGPNLHLFKKFFYYRQSFFFRSIKIIINNNPIKLRCKSQLIRSTFDTVVYNFSSIRCPSFKTMTQFFYAWRLNKYAQSPAAIKLFYVASSLDINIENNIFPFIELTFHLLFQCTIKTVFIDLFMFQKFIIFNTSAKLFGRKKKIFYTILLCPSRRTTRRTDTECQIQFFMLHQPIDYCTFAATTWC